MQSQGWVSRDALGPWGGAPGVGFPGARSKGLSEGQRAEPRPHLKPVLVKGDPAGQRQDGAIRRSGSEGAGTNAPLTPVLAAANREGLPSPHP